MCRQQKRLRPCRPSTGVLRPSGPKTAKKSQKSLPGPSGPESQKSPKKVETPPKMTLFGDFSGTLRPFRDFSETLGQKAQEDFFETFSRFSARRASRLL